MKDTHIKEQLYQAGNVKPIEQYIVNKIDSIDAFLEGELSREERIRLEAQKEVLNDLRTLMQKEG